MATMAATNARDVGPKDLTAHSSSSTKIDLANIADVPYYVESNVSLASVPSSPVPMTIA